MGRHTYTHAQVLAAWWARVDDHSDPDGCWLWTGGKTQGRVVYGVMWVRGRQVGAHRYAFETVGGGRIPPGWEVGHTCHVGLCVRPNHLAACSHADNEAAKDAAARRPRGVLGLPCPRCGGPQDGRSQRGAGREFAYCVPCRRDYQRRYQQARRAAARET